jgi:hypothetical protein
MGIYKDEQDRLPLVGEDEVIAVAVIGNDDTVVYTKDGQAFLHRPVLSDGVALFQRVTFRIVDE